VSRISGILLSIWIFCLSLGVHTYGKSCRAPWGKQKKHCPCNDGKTKKKCCGTLLKPVKHQQFGEQQQVKIPKTEIKAIPDLSDFPIQAFPAKHGISLRPIPFSWKPPDWGTQLYIRFRNFRC
jgi:hypothetical protein